ncbi:MAG: rRNA maturation RNase YbeY [bacterium]
MDIQISFQYKKNNKSLRAVSTELKRFATKLDTDNKVLVAFVDDTTIQQINKRFKHRDRPTNVLSFELDQMDPEDGKITLGEIIISVDTAEREASGAGIPLIRRLIELFIHGYVHLLGYDHTLSHNEYVRMKRKEDSFMRLIYAKDRRTTGKKV